MTDTISDMLTRIRNAQAAKKLEAVLPYSKFKESLAKILLAEGWIKSVDLKDERGMRSLVIELKYGQDGSPIISGIKRISKPGLRVYRGHKEIPRIFGGMSVSIVSTPKGLMTDKLARQQKVGGEVVCQIW